MKWFNAAKTACLDLDKIVYWNYTSREAIEAYKVKIKNIRKQDPSAFVVDALENTRIEIYIGGDAPLTFDGANADEIYKMLTSTKEIL